MESPENCRIAARLARRFEGSTDTLQIAAAIVSVWEHIDAELCPIIGQRGVAGLYRRSTHLAGQVYPWLHEIPDSISTTLDLSTLQQSLVQQTPDDAIAGGGLLLQTFYELLANLIGPSLAERLLRSVWATFFSSPPARDASS
jgi:hypothetical protein